MSLGQGQSSASSTAVQGTRNLSHLRRFQSRAQMGGPGLVPGAAPAGQPAWFMLLPGGPTINLWINPQTYHEETQSLFQEIPTLGGMVRLNFGEQPVSIALEGTTGTAGWDAADHGGMEDLDRLKPQNNYPDVAVAFHFPYMFSGARYCYVNTFVQETRPDAPLFYYYRIDLACYDVVQGESPSYIPVDPAAPNGRQPDCHYSSLNLPWTNQTHPPGYSYWAQDPNDGGKWKHLTSPEQEEQLQGLYQATPCVFHPKPVRRPLPSRVARRTPVYHQIMGQGHEGQGLSHESYQPPAMDQWGTPGYTPPSPEPPPPGTFP